MRTQTETRSLPTELSPEDLAKESDKLAAAVKDVEKQEEHIAEQKGLWTEKKKAMEGYLSHLKGEMNELANVVDTGRADRDVPCSWLYALGTGYAFLVRDDNGELVTHRKLRDEERQVSLLEPVREPTPEQLAGWIESLGLVLDPQGDLPLAAPEASEGGVPPSYYRVFVLPDGGHGQEKITARFSEADHRPSSLTGVFSHPEESDKTGLPEQVNRATLVYEEEPETVRAYRAVLESMLEEKQLEARRSRTAPEREPGEDEEPQAPTPTGRGRRGK